MEIVGALDIHRQQITFKWEEIETGEVHRGKIVPATRDSVRDWLDAFRGRDAHFALEATTGWRFVAEEIHTAGLTPHLAETAETHTMRGSKRRAKTDLADCDHMIKLLRRNDLPEAWIPPAQILELRTMVRLRKDLIDQRTEWQQRIQAQLFHQGAPAGIRLRTSAGRDRLAEIELSPAGRRLIEAGIDMIDFLDEQLDPIDRELGCFARRQAGCRALAANLYGVGLFTAAAIVAELGDCRRFTRSMQAVRYAGLDVTVYQSDTKRAAGHLSKQGPDVLRWALVEAAQCAARPSSPDHGFYVGTKGRLGHGRAAMSVARKIARRAYHLLRELGDDAIAAVEDFPRDAPRPVRSAA